MADGFLGRWARRKEAVRKGEAVPDAPAKDLRPKELPGGAAAAVPPGDQGLPVAAAPETASQAEPEPEPPPTLADAEALTPQSDFRRFVQPGVAPEVKNAALKKLFADPHFNVMDGLDTYIGDYSQPDPIPPEMLRQLAGAHFLGMFDDEEAKKKKAAQQQNAKPGGSPAESPLPREVADDRAPQTVAQSAERSGVEVAPAQTDGDPDLRLQPDDAPGPEGPGAGDR